MCFLHLNLNEWRNNCMYLYPTFNRFDSYTPRLHKLYGVFSSASYDCNFLMIWAGTPPTRTLCRNDIVTTDPAPITTPLPKVTPVFMGYLRHAVSKTKEATVYSPGNSIIGTQPNIIPNHNRHPKLFSCHPLLNLFRMSCHTNYCIRFNQTIVLNGDGMQSNITTPWLARHLGVVVLWIAVFDLCRR